MRKSWAESTAFSGSHGVLETFRQRVVDNGQFGRGFPQQMLCFCRHRSKFAQFGSCHFGLWLFHENKEQQRRKPTKTTPLLFDLTI